MKRQETMCGHELSGEAKQQVGFAFYTFARIYNKKCADKNEMEN